MPKSKKNPRGSFAKIVPRAKKRRTGRTLTEDTPLAVRTTGLRLSPAQRKRVRARTGAKLGKFATHIERTTVRFEDVNGPKGGRALRCRIKVTISGRPSLLVEKEGRAVSEVFDLTIDAMERAVREGLRKAGVRAPRLPPRKLPATRPEPSPAPPRRRAKQPRPVEPVSPIPTAADGSLIGRRVGRSAAVLANVADRPEKRRRDVPVDTAQPGKSATDRKVGAGSTAKRNTKLNVAGMVAALEDSQKGRPSRKSTRTSLGRARRDTPQHLAKVAKVRSAKAQASAAKAARGR